MAAVPTFTPDGFTSPGHTSPVSVTIATVTTGANIRYTIIVAGSTPNNPTFTNGTLIAASSGAVSVGAASTAKTLCAVAYLPGNGASVSAMYCADYDFFLEPNP